MVTSHLGPSNTIQIKVTPDLRRCPPGKKIRICAILKKNMVNYISLERLSNVDSGKKI